MKVAVHMSMFCKTWSDDIRPFLPKLKLMGFDGVEISMFGAKKSMLNDVFHLCNDLDLEFMCGTGISEDTDISSNDIDKRNRGVDYLVESINLAKEGGAKSLNGVLYAPWKSFDYGNRMERWERSSNELKKVIKLTSNNFPLNIEVLNRFESNFINTLEEGATFLKMIDSPNVKLLADTFHMNIEEKNMIDSIDKYYDEIGYIHVCENNRGVPGSASLPFKQLIKLLKKKNYEGYLTMECITKCGTEVANGMSIWRDLGMDERIEAKKGLDFLKNIIGEKNYE